MKTVDRRFILSDETVNSFGFKVLTAGIDFQGYLSNPVMLYNHNFDKLIGQFTDLLVSEGKLTGLPSFDEEDPEAMKYCNKAEQGILNGASIGLTPIEFDEQAHEMKRCSIKEISLTPVPANENAIAVYSLAGKKLAVSDVSGYLLSGHTDPLIYDSSTSMVDIAILNNPALKGARQALIDIGNNNPTQLKAMLSPYMMSNKRQRYESDKTYDFYALNAPDELLIMQEREPARFEKLVQDKLALVRLTSGHLIG
ncbi:MAG: HK97 family phage prohead protease [Daejeonella sp.]